MTILFGSVLFSSALICVFIFKTDAPLAQFGSHLSTKQNRAAFDIPIHLKKVPIPLPIPRLDEAISFSCERARPGIGEECGSYLIRLKKANLKRRLTLPARVDLKFDKELQFSNEESPFWAEIQKEGSEIAAYFFVARNENREEVGTYRFSVEEANIRSSSEFPERSPFKILADSKILGRDLFLKTYKDGMTTQRIEMCNQVFPIKEGDFLVWKDDKWQLVQSLLDTENLPIARCSVVDDRSVLFETWGLDGFARIAITSVLQIPLKTKSEEFLSSVRIRSEKQISCMLDKQCFVLRVGDWILKEENRWKILRKNEEKNSYLQGKIEGELFVFDRIDLKNGQKNIQGNLVNLNRSQMISVNVVAQCQKKTLNSREKGRIK